MVSQAEYNILLGNEVFYTDTTLACATSGTPQPQWSYKENQNGNVYNPSAVNWNLTTGISTLSIHTTEQGYYTCTPVAGGTTYAVAIFNSDITTGNSLSIGAAGFQEMGGIDDVMPTRLYFLSYDKVQFGWAYTQSKHP